MTLESEALGICGAARCPSAGATGRSSRTNTSAARPLGKRGAFEAWETRPAARVAAYTLLAEESLGQAITEARVRYHATKTTVRVPVDDELRGKVRGAVERARALPRDGGSTSRHGQRAPLCPVLPRAGLPARGGTAGR